MARHGLREQYRPLHSPLCPSSDPLMVVAAYLRLYPFRVLYLADLDAINHQEDNGIILSRIHRAYPDLILWIDRGWPPVPYHRTQTPVIGSESLKADWQQTLASIRTPWILSLDFDTAGFRGPETLLENPGRWPPEVILMSLAKVGSEAGPDWQRLRYFLDIQPEHLWVAAGGIRHQQDLLRLETMGIQRALIASALHQGKVHPRQYKSRRHDGGGFPQ